MRLAIIAALITGPAFAGYAEHPGVTLFTEKPCTAAVAAIDYDGNAMPALAEKGMAWGFLLGFDTAAGGISGDNETTLVRLRSACADSPDTPAIKLLEGFKPTEAPRPASRPTPDL